MMKILVVDDHEENRYMLEVLLKGYGYEVDSASDGVEALEKAVDDDFDMIISDILMPVMDGFQLCREVKKDERLKKIAFVFYTASYTEPEDEQFALKLGAESFIVKPTDPDDFIEILKKIIKDYEAGKLVVPEPPIEDETVYVKGYNERLIKKLENKMLEVESANRSIKESEEKYRDLIDNANDAVIVFDKTGYISFVNPKFSEITGYSIDEAKKLHFNKLIHPDDLEMVTGYFEKRLRGEKVHRNYEVRLLTKAGKTIYIDNNTSIMEKEGGIIGILTIMRDITARKLAEEQIHKLSRAVEQSPSLVMITDLKGNIEYVNPKYTQITGYTPEEVIGKNPRILKSGKTQPEEYKRLWNTIISGGEWRGEFYNRKKNGEFYWESASISSIKNSKGVITHFIAVKEDITERKQAEDEIRMHAHTLKSINDCVSIADMDNTIISVNKAFCDVYGYKEEEILGKNASVLWSSLSPKELTREILPHTLKGGWSGELYNKRKDGSNFPIYLSTSFIRDEKDKPIALVGVARDITERKQAESALSEANKIINRSPAVAFLWKNEEDWPVEFVSENIEKLSGYSAQEFLERKISYSQIIHSNDIERVAGEVATYSKKEGLQTFAHEPYRIITKTGDIKWIDDITYIRRDSRGIITHYEGIVYDITERKRAEEEIKSLAKFPSENPNPILRFDLNDVLQYANDAALKFFSDWKLKEGKAIPVVLQELTHDIEKQSSIMKDIPYREQIFSVSVTFHQEFGYIDVYAIDTTERKRAEETLRALKSYTENIITSMTDALFVIAPDATIQTVNTAAITLLGYTEDELIGKAIRMVFEEGGEEEVFTEQALSNVEEKLQVIYDHDPEDFRSLLKSALIGAVIVSSNGKIVMTNREIESIFGYDQGELIGKMIHELLPAKLRDVHEKRRVEFMDRPHPRFMGKGGLLKAQRKDRTMFDLEVGLFPLQMDGEMHVLSVIRDSKIKERWEFIRFTRFGRLFTEEEVFWNVDRTLVAKNGEKIPVLMSGSLMRNGSDEIYRTVLVVKDITERKQAEEELAKHREHLEELVKERTEELEKKNAELKRFNKLFVGREFRIKELKEKVKELESRLKKNRGK